MFNAIHGYNPFPWQLEAASRLVDGRFFSEVNVPTASGKTALIDAAIYAAAHGGPRRIAFIIDRRVVVDEAHLRAKRIVKALAEERSLASLKAKLGQVQVVRLRGGVHGDDDWVLYPDRLTVIISTVDQVGSRLLHRGYGVSPRMSPLHSGFVGNDALYIIDEAHISTPFVETVESARRYGADVRVITMTATPACRAAERLELTVEDRSHPVMQKRLMARKIARLVRIVDKEDVFVREVVSAAQQLAESARVIGIVVNRVSSARRIHQALDKTNYRSELLTGRVRPYDRDHLMDSLLPEIRAGRVREDGAPLFIVATQTIEVGADLDFDALVTEGASLDALRQRFGRLDRLGELASSEGVVIFRPKVDKIGAEMPDPIYGTTIHDTWKWLQDVSEDGSVDFGISAIEESLKRKEAPATEAKHAPVLLPTHINLLGQTGPSAPYVDVSPWLHGAQSGSADVSLIWRADLYPESSDRWAETARLRPPLTREALEIPIYAARSWLENRRAPEVTDLEGVESVTDSRGRSDKCVLRWRGPEDCEVVFPRDLRPGDTVMLPSAYGGCDAYGWAPTYKEPVRDIADFCSLERQRGHVVRLASGLTGWLGASESAITAAVKELVSSETEVDPETGVDESRVEESHTKLRSEIGEVDHPLIKAFRGRFEIERHPRGVVLRGRVIDEVNATLNAGVAVELDRHLEGVARLVGKLAGKHPQRELIKRAARQHDCGKAETRFQTMLHGSPLSAAAGPVLAKSGLRKLSQIMAAYRQSGLPKGFRHELASLAPVFSGASEELDKLVRHLIATHHGYGRPWFPACADPQAPGADLLMLGSGWAEAFAELFGRHGPWQLAGMELLLRASDARQSIKEQGERRV
jgi:CRISPR-associated endonuclease/helicase Cas3